MSGVFVGENEDVSKGCSGDPSQDCNYLHIVSYGRLLHRPSFVLYNVVGRVWVCGICCPFLYH